MQAFSAESVFEAQVETALEQVKQILDVNRNPQLPTEVGHQYQDKYLLAEFLTNTAINSYLVGLESLGLTSEQLKKLIDWAKNSAVTIRFEGTEHCTFIKKVKRKIESDTKHVREVSGFFGKIKRTEKVFTKFTEYHWDYKLNYEIFFYPGNNKEEKLVLLNKERTFIIINKNNELPPKPKIGKIPEYQVNITWFFQQFTDDQKLNFQINRKKKTCYTPTRNQDVTVALQFFSEFFSFSKHLGYFFRDSVFPIQLNAEGSEVLDLSILNDFTIFNPVLPLFESFSDEGEENKIKIEEKNQILSKNCFLSFSESKVIPISDLNLFINQQKIDTQKQFENLEKILPENKNLVNFGEGKIIIVTSHLNEVAQYLSDSIFYIEALLYSQLNAAIGKTITSKDFREYLIFHFRKLYKSHFQPQKFSFAVRRPGFFPEGVISIESNPVVPVSSNSSVKTEVSEPVATICKVHYTEAPMTFDINTATTITFTGEKYVHAWLEHEFQQESFSSKFTLNLRARQFSSYLVLIGKIISPTQFDPSYGIIVKNKDEIRVPLDLEKIPSAKHFKQAVQSLSPEQQDFAKAIRNMQLESSLFGILVIQIKPQLEVLLNLPNSSLTKEIELTQDLLELFIKYQIPSDLLSFEGSDLVLPEQRISFVKEQVKQMQAVIEQSKQEALKEVNQALDFLNPLGLSTPSSSYEGGGGYSNTSSSNIIADNTPDLAVAPSSEPLSSDQPIEPTTDGDEQEGFNVTNIPHELDKKFEELDMEGAVRPTIITPGSTWNKKCKKTLFSKETEKTLQKRQLEKNRNKAFDLLDSLTKSGLLTLSDTSLHVVIAATHCFERTLLSNLIEKNVNPIDHVERTALTIASTIYQLPPSELVDPELHDRVASTSPQLF